MAPIPSSDAYFGLETLTDQERLHLDLAMALGRQATRIRTDIALLTPTKLDRLAEANAQQYITHKDYPRMLDFVRMTQLFIRVFVDAYATYQRTYK